MRTQAQISGVDRDENTQTKIELPPDRICSLQDTVYKDALPLDHGHTSMISRDFLTHFIKTSSEAMS